MIITVDMLKMRGACSWGIAQFRDTFGESAELTMDNLYHANDADLPLNFLYGCGGIRDPHTVYNTRSENVCYCVSCWGIDNVIAYLLSEGLRIDIDAYILSLPCLTSLA